MSPKCNDEFCYKIHLCFFYFFYFLLLEDSDSNEHLTWSQYEFYSSSSFTWNFGWNMCPAFKNSSPGILKQGSATFCHHRPPFLMQPPALSCTSPSSWSGQLLALTLLA